MATYTEHLELNGLDEEDELTDDEVFTRGGKSIPLDENGISKPLMAPRHRASKTDVLHTRVRKVPPLRVIWGPIIYGLIALGAVIGIICLVVFLINTFMAHLSTSHRLLHTQTQQAILPCTNITVSDIWFQTFPMLTTETAVRLDDINLDGAEDIIMGFGTGADAFYYPPVVCDVYFDGKKACGGGILALNGRTGQEIWRRYTPHEIFGINCNADLDGDKIKDCIGAGRMAGLLAVSGKDGTVIWNFKDSDAKIKTSNMYTPVYINDINSDGVPDLVQIHGGDPLKEPGSPTRLIGRLLVISGRNGQVVQWVEVPDKKESYYSPQILTHPDGSQLVMFGTGGETHGGSLWYISLADLLNGHIEKADTIYTDKYKGIMTPPVLIDITKDGVLDIVMAMFNSSVIAFNGLTFETIWVSHFPSSESYSTPGVGYFNDDDVPDFIVNYQTGPGFPVYYYTQTTILDGRNGQHLLSEPIKMVVGTQSSPLVISAEGFGNDIFLYWVSDCHGVSGESYNLEFSFVHGTTIHEQSRADFCKLRFKEKLFTRMYALNHASGPPGTIMYDSDTRQQVEHRNSLNYTEIGLKFLEKNPDYWTDYYNYPSQGEKNGQMKIMGH
ncbi:uncharacterized protein LOC106468446 isoform X1 [Limulus polyphemus]|uniref:Uncharacterized protein LOC106468446 isoform X1 n=1 Tax=Limulus polyphemus TaxID=6850 RepID=A0ABM1T9D2_LIMPO|nr:uncharacterized protein LOC106468446 isoform X1 [Limulus polyphemus]